MARSDSPAAVGESEAPASHSADEGVQAIYFANPAELRAWFEAHHADRDELWVGFYKKATGRQGLSWAQSVREALCFGWIDSVMRPIDGERHEQRFTPRRKGSTWSIVNVRIANELKGAGLMRPAGQRAFEARTPENTGVYSSENREAAVFSEDEAAALATNAEASAFFAAQAPSYRRAATWWVVSAKKPETRTRRMQMVLDDSAAGRVLKQFARRPAASAKAAP